MKNINKAVVHILVILAIFGCTNVVVITLIDEVAKPEKIQTNIEPKKEPVIDD